MPQVVLKRTWFTGWGRFKRNLGGVSIPQHVIDKFGLPKDAKIVAKDYVAVVSDKVLQPHEALKASDLERQNAESEGAVHDGLNAQAEAPAKAGVKLQLPQSDQGKENNKGK